MKTIQIIKPSISNIEMMYQLIIKKHPKVINDYIEASKLICIEFKTSIDQYDLEKALDVDIESNIEDLRLIYNNVK